MDTFKNLADKQDALIAILGGSILKDGTKDGTKYIIQDGVRVAQGITMKTDTEMIAELATIPIETTTTKTVTTFLGGKTVTVVSDPVAIQRVRSALNKAAGEYIFAKMNVEKASGAGRRSRKNRNRRSTRRNNRRSNRATRSRK